MTDTQTDWYKLVLVPIEQGTRYCWGTSGKTFQEEARESINIGRVEYLVREEANRSLMNLRGLIRGQLDRIADSLPLNRIPEKITIMIGKGGSD